MLRSRTAPRTILAAVSALLALGAPLSARGQSILTVAGGGIDDGRLATDVRLNDPHAAVETADGTIFVAEAGGQRIRRIEPGTGRILTFAGNGYGAFSGDGGPASSTSFNVPAALLLHDGGLLVADTWNHRIRRIDLTTGTVSTWAGGGTSLGDGGPARSAAFGCPGGLAHDSGGNVYVSDSCDCRVRRIDATSGTIATVAGTGTCAYGGTAAPRPPRGSGARGDWPSTPPATSSSPTRPRGVSGRSPPRRGGSRPSQETARPR